VHITATVVHITIAAVDLTSADMFIIVWVTDSKTTVEITQCYVTQLDKCS
jgi:hypothetical protein